MYRNIYIYTHIYIYHRYSQRFQCVSGSWGGVHIYIYIERDTERERERERERKREREGLGLGLVENKGIHCIGMIWKFPYALVTANELRDCDITWRLERDLRTLATPYTLHSCFLSCIDI